MSTELSDLQSLAIGLFALELASAFVRRVPWLGRAGVPVPVVGGVLVAIVVTGLYRYAGLSIQFASTLRDFFLLVFFTSVGLSAKLSALKAGGRPLVILCVVTVPRRPRRRRSPLCCK